MIAAKAEAERIAAMEEAERIRHHEKEVTRIQVKADRIHFHETSMTRETNDSATMPRNSGRIPKLPVFCGGNDDMDSYLQRLERYAENEGWDADCYGTCLGSLYQASEACDYYKLT